MKQDKFIQTDTGAKYPRVTTVLDTISSWGLINWMIWKSKPCRICAQLGNCEIMDKFRPSDKIQSPLDFSCLLFEGKTVGEVAADYGSGAHDQLFHYFSGHEIDLTDNNPFHISITPVLDWAKTVGFEPVQIEQQVVSEKYGFGGHLDMLAKVNGVLSVIDWKTSNQLRWTYLLQTIAYKQAWNENHPDEQATECYIFRLPKLKKDEQIEDLKDPKGEVLYIPADKHEDLLNIFCMLLSIYNYDKKILTTPKKIREWLQNKKG
jgi:hypothetical protein